VQCFDVLSHVFRFDPQLSLFTAQHNHIQLLVDESHLWALFAYVPLTSASAKSRPKPQSTNTDAILVLQFDLPDKIDQELSLRRVIPLPEVSSRPFGSMFIVCGVLYALDSVSQPNAHISFAYDLYAYQEINLGTGIAFTNPFQSNNFITYNPAQQKIFGWDHSTLIEYPLLLEP
jgi:hypothetical protein